MSAKHAQTPRLRRPMSAELRAKLRAAQLAYVVKDPRWTAHRQKLADAQTARRMTLFPNEVDAILKMRAEGQTFRQIARKSALRATSPAVRSGSAVLLFPLPGVQAHDAFTERDRRHLVEAREGPDIDQEIGVCSSVIRRELRKGGYSTALVKADKRAKGGRGFWRPFEEANPFCHCHSLTARPVRVISGPAVAPLGGGGQQPGTPITSRGARGLRNAPQAASDEGWTQERYVIRIAE